MNDKHIKISYIDDIQNPDSKVRTTTMKITMEDGPAPRKEIPEGDRKYIVSRLRQWLGEDGVRQFKKWRTDHGTVSPVLFYGKYPHAVHFREGMQVRNFLRAFFKQNWNDHEYDDNWQWLVEEAIDLNEPIEPIKPDKPVREPDANRINKLLNLDDEVIFEGPEEPVPFPKKSWWKFWK